MKIIINIIVVFLLLNSCKKTIFDGSYTYTGKWEIVSYKLNNYEKIDTKLFYSKKFLIYFYDNSNKLNIEPIDCSNCGFESLNYSMEFAYNEDTKDEYLLFSNFSMNIRLDSSLYPLQFDLNPFNYQTNDTSVYSFMGHSYSWNQTLSSSKVMKLSNLYDKNRVNDISIILEKY